MPCGIKAVLFDLDGTLLDTAGDLSFAVNQLLLDNDRKPLPLPQLRPYVSQGGLTMVSVAFDLPRESEQAYRLWQQYLEIYSANLCHMTELFDGMEQVLNNIENKGLSWGIVTNKPARFTIPLLDALELKTRAGCVVSGDTTANAKPAPDPILHACELLGASASSSLMIGDDRRDIIAGQAAGAQSLAALWGYIQPHDDPQTWNADAELAHPDQINGWID